MDNKQNFQRRTFTFCVDGLTSVIASVMGSSGITAFVESASGIRAGGRTGLTALTVALYFAATLFFNPLICERPPPVCKDGLLARQDCAFPVVQWLAAHRLPRGTESCSTEFELHHAAWDLCAEKWHDVCFTEIDGTCRWMWLHQPHVDMSFSSRCYVE